MSSALLSLPSRGLVRLAAVLLLGQFAAGCTAARASYFVLDAQRKYQTAVESGAEERAVYEITLAREYLWKAKEEVNSSEFGAAEQLCKKSVTWSAQAVEKSDDRGIDVKNADQFVPEVKPEKPPEPKDDTRIDIDLDDL